MSGKNPFSDLFAGARNEDEASRRVAAEVTQIAENVFNISFTRDNESVESGRIPQLVYLEEVAETLKNSSVDMETLKIALFERILLAEPGRHVITTKKMGRFTSSIHVVQDECITYLFECYKRLKAMSWATLSFTEEDVVSIVVQNFATALRQPELFDGQNVHAQLVTLYALEETATLTTLIKDVVQSILSEESKSVVHDAFRPVLMLVHKDFANSTVMTFCRSNFALLSSFISNQTLAEFIMIYTSNAAFGPGIAYGDTLFGAMLNLSCLPKSVEGPIEYFEKPLDGALSALEGNLWTAMNELCERVHGLFEQILRMWPELRHKVLTWLGGCLDANTNRGRLWATTSLGLPGAVDCVPDGFALNLASVLLRLCQPFMNDTRKLLKIDPTYPAFRVELREDMSHFGVHCRSLYSETCLQPVEEGEVRPFSTQPYSFITECFFMTQRALDLSTRVVLERTLQLYQEIGRLQRTLTDAQALAIPRMDIVETFRVRMEMEMSRYLCMRCALLEPVMLNLLGQFEVATSIWLIQVIIDPNHEKRDNYAPLQMRELKFPLPEGGPPTLRCIPELVVESVARFTKLAKTYSPKTFEEGGDKLMDPLLSILLVVMGCKKRARNPHLRANVAQCLECLLPRDQDQPSLNPNPLGVFYREKLFTTHPHRDQIVGCLLEVFVSIEMTGESVRFEQRFNYRRPMYTVMDYLWGLEEHRAIFKKLAADAEANMEEVTPPLFLRFLNLLMNDAVFLLDEALTNMAQIRTLQTARSSGEWENLPPEESDRNEQYFRQIGITARFDNILGKETIHTLEYMSSEIKSILCHRTMVDRIAAMLNYFLFHLVGPKKKNLKVKDHDEYKFDPGGIVKDICRIYVNLGSSSEFCAAISRDGRSYSPQLFVLAQDVLARIGGVDLMAQLETVANQVARLAALQQTDEELLAEAPEEFLDPIMSTLMSDPVTLPSSRINIDRATIARHLLSDQTDPFNRSFLTMNMVKTNEELKQRIADWVADKRGQSSKS